MSRDGLRGPQPGWSAISVCQLKGHSFSVPEGDGKWTWSDGHFTYFLDNSPVTDAALQSLGPMPELNDLSLTRTLITDEAVPMIVKQFPGLEVLRLDRTTVTDKNLGELGRLNSLEQLSLFRTRISDSGCSKLAKMSTLRKLSLDQTHITDVGFKALGQISKLESLSVWKTQVTDEAAAEFSQLYPNMRLNR